MYLSYLIQMKHPSRYRGTNVSSQYENVEAWQPLSIDVLFDEQRSLFYNS